MENLLVIDLEMCKVDRNVIRGRKIYLDSEIIQIGAVILGKKNRIVDEWKSYVQPEYGNLDEFIETLTGIKDIDLRYAPKLADALKKMSNWLAGRTVTASSWSVSDEVQLSVETEQKKIENPVIAGLLENWVDLQKSYGRARGAKNAMALEKAMRAEDIRPEGRAHDGADDAKNTALLIAKLLSDGVELEFEPINSTFEYHDEEEESFTNNPFAGLKF